MSMDKLQDKLSQLYVAISNNEYTFPEYNNLRTKKARKEQSLKALGITNRLIRLEGVADAAPDSED